MLESRNFLICVPTRGDRPIGRLVSALASISQEFVDYRLFLDAHCASSERQSFFLNYGDRVVDAGCSGYASLRNYMLSYAMDHDYSHAIFFDDDQLPVLGWIQGLLGQL